MGNVGTSYAKSSHSEPSCSHWNLWSIQISSMTPTQFETRSEVEVYQDWKKF